MDEKETKIVEALKYKGELVVKVTTETLYSFPYDFTRGYTKDSFLEFAKHNLIKYSPYKLGHSDKIVKMEYLR